MSARPSSVALLQLRAHDRAAFAERWPVIRTRIAQAADGGAMLIVLPEGTVPAYLIGEEQVERELLADAARDVIEIAARSGATIVYGSGRYDGDRFFNSAYVATADGIVGTADKAFLWHFDRRWFSAGEKLEPVSTPLGRLGVLICADGRIPTIASTLVDRGAEVLVMPTAWVSSGRDPATLENIQADLMVNVRAFENGVPLVAANKIGVEARSIAYCGKSAIIAADGSFVERATQDAETTLTGSLAIGPSIARRPDTPIPTIERGTLPTEMPSSARIAIAARHDPALHALARAADAAVVLDPHAHPLPADVGVVQDEAILDPRALVGPRLGGVRLFVWHASIATRWVTALARTRAAELRAYVAVLDTLGQRAFAVDPDGVVVGGTFPGFDLAAFAYDRTRTETWTIAPSTDVRAGLEAVGSIGARSTAAP